MTASEFSNEFDIGYNNLVSNGSPALDLWQKSVFLTRAQEEIVKNYLNPYSNIKQVGVDGSPKRQIDLYSLITVKKLSDGDITLASGATIDERGILINFPTDIVQILNEFATIVFNTATIKTTVIPISYLEYSRLLVKPYKEPLKNHSWRLMHSIDGSIVPEIIIKSNSTLSDYSIRYIRKPYPIILTDLSEYGVTIDGETSPLSVDGQVCELDVNVHSEVLNRAIELAKVKVLGDAPSIIELNKRNE
jgi:hypothetical protein